MQFQYLLSNYSEYGPNNSTNIPRLIFVQNTRLPYLYRRKPVCSTGWSAHAQLSLSLFQIYWQVVIKDHNSAFNAVTIIYTLIKWMVSLADFQPQTIALKTNFFYRQPRFYRWKNNSVKFMPELRIVLNSLRGNARFSRLTFRAKYSDFNW